MFKNYVSWEHMVSLECAACQAERKRRCRVAPSGDPSLKQEPFVSAIYIHPHNTPKYHALQLRAIEFAKANQRILLWIIARDNPLTTEDLSLSRESLKQRKEAWLGFHDQQTAGIMGMFPCVRGLRVRITDKLDADLKIFKNSTGFIVGWELSEEEEIAQGCFEHVLSAMPLCIYVKIRKATWQLPGLEVGVYPLKPRKRVWYRDRGQTVGISRTGFTLVADLSGTAHSKQGCTEPAVIADCLEVDSKPTPAEMLTSYIAKSRVRSADDLKIIQPYAPQLFKQGPAPGPSVLMERLRGDLDSRAAKEKVERLEKLREKQADTKSLHDLLWSCKACADAKRSTESQKAVAFGARRPCEVLPRVLAQGFWRRCNDCKILAARQNCGEHGALGGEHGALGGEHGALGGEHGALGRGPWNALGLLASPRKTQETCAKCQQVLPHADFETWMFKKKPQFASLPDLPAPDLHEMWHSGCPTTAVQV